MKRKTAFKLAIESIQKVRHKHMFDANLYRKGVVKSIRTENAHKHALRLEKAIEHLKEGE